MKGGGIDLWPVGLRNRTVVGCEWVGGWQWAGGFWLVVVLWWIGGRCLVVVVMLLVG